MLEIKNIKKSFGEIKALDDINLKIEEKEFFGLLGPNGAGKSTLMNLIVGYLDQDKGEVLVGNEPSAFKHRKDIGYVPQEIALYQELSAYQNFKIFGSFYEVKNIEKKIDELFELVQLTDRKKDVVKNFSGGMKRRLNIAVSLMHDPKIILCDEPTVGVDPQSRNAIFDVLQDLNSIGKTIIYTTHYMEEAERLCSKLAIIDNGKIIANGSLEDLTNSLNNSHTIKLVKSIDVLKNKESLQKYFKIAENENNLELIPLNGNNKLSEQINELEKSGISSSNIEFNRASLEDVFLHLTGRSLRD